MKAEEGQREKLKTEMERLHTYITQTDLTSVPSLNRILQDIAPDGTSISAHISSPSYY